VCHHGLGQRLVVRRGMLAALVRAGTTPFGSPIGVRPDPGSSGTAPKRSGSLRIRGVTRPPAASGKNHGFPGHVSAEVMR
jgi:hypothetical protein